VREEMTELDVCRLSAEALTLPLEIQDDVVWIHRHGGRNFSGKEVRAGGTRWNPLLNAEQRWECVEFLLKQGWRIEFGHSGQYLSKPLEQPSHTFMCPASEFPARAVAELQRRKA
jgi:hypothetical protein